MAIPLAAIGLGISAASAMASIGQGIYNSSQQNEANKANYELQRDTLDLQREQQQWNREKADRDFEYNKQLQEKIFQREDSAVQRMVADNRAAGLSPIAGLAGAGTGQALEANTPQLNQTFDTPQMSANQLTTDFSSLSQLGSQITNYEMNKKGMEIQQEKLKLEKSSNEANLRQMEENIKASQIKNQISRATMKAEIENRNLAPQKTAQEIGRIGSQVLNDALDREIKELSKIQTEREMDEWLENKGLRAEIGNVSLDEAKAKVLALEMVNKYHNDEYYGTQLDVLKEELTKIQNENKSYADKQELYKALSAGTGNSAAGGLIIQALMTILGMK